jgi:hypothetical protein
MLGVLPLGLLELHHTCCCTQRCCACTAALGPCRTRPHARLQPNEIRSKYAALERTETRNAPSSLGGHFGSGRRTAATSVSMPDAPVATGGRASSLDQRPGGGGISRAASAAGGPPVDTGVSPGQHALQTLMTETSFGSDTETVARATADGGGDNVASTGASVSVVGSHIRGVGAERRLTAPAEAVAPPRSLSTGSSRSLKDKFRGGSKGTAFAHRRTGTRKLQARTAS